MDNVYAPTCSRKYKFIADFSQVLTGCLNIC